MPKNISEKQKKQLVDLVKNGQTVAEVCKLASVSRSDLYRWMSMFALRKRWAAQDEIDLNHVYKLERRLATLEEENAIFRKNGCGTKASNAEKVAAVKALKGQFTEHAICRTLDLSKPHTIGCLSQGRLGSARRTMSFVQPSNVYSRKARNDLEEQR